jgi:hypothetical protein
MTAEVDPFDLPEWLGEQQVVWRPDSGIGGYHVTGELTSDDGGPLPCDLLAVDEAYPKPVADDVLRHQAHQAWRHGQVLLVDLEGRVTLAVPGTSFTADRILESLSRLAKAVGATPGSLAALLRPGE